MLSSLEWRIGNRSYWHISSCGLTISTCRIDVRGSQDGKRNTRRKNSVNRDLYQHTNSLEAEFVMDSTEITISIES
ncbi:uncharacterized protein LOC131223704 isoform X3 [Magnolia sinica]|uniref:uncharacterized protein LOC131223704 isoform X3 n=1 Tax=Magnolia sinica TaxID=86752 RepID=UPI002659A8BD|nr:uncharacterized protein LOC131223704 isoform X3 [Magnolia sinica]